MVPLSESHPELAAQWCPERNDAGPERVSARSSLRVWWQHAGCGHRWHAEVRQRVKGQGCLICSNRQVSVGVNDLVTTHPHLADQWHLERNDKAAAEFVAGTPRKAWWRCDLGHEWEASIAKRAGGQGCPVCSNRRVLVGFNDLQTTHPELAAQWHPTRNDLAATDVVFGSPQKVWWRCAEGHEWTASLNSRSNPAVASGCPVCVNQIAAAGVNDLQTTHPELAAQWHPTRNGRGPDCVVAGSTQVVWWRAEDCGHEWEAEVRLRARGVGCPFCASQRVLVGFNDLATRNPELAAQWHPTRNSVTAQQVTARCQRKIWWRSEECGHEWEASVDNRARGAGCPFCSSQALLAGFNDLLTCNPELAAEWHPVRNAVGPDQIAPLSGQKVWWLSPDCGHEWAATVSSRAAGNGCPTCWAQSYSSKAERELGDFVAGLHSAVERCYRKLPGVSEVDLYLPGLSLAFEYNGVFWHSEGRVGRTLHLRKWQACAKAGVRLVQIWEDDWLVRRDIVERMIRRLILGPDKATTVYARRTTVRGNLTTGEARRFLQANHIQGFAGGALKVGLQDAGGDLVAVACFKRRDDETLELTRYATDRNVPGGLGKILRHVERSEPGVRRIVTFADHCISGGDLYERLGFRAEAVLEPDFTYRVGAERVHKFGFRRERFKKDPTLRFDPQLSGRELADLNGFDRIWDAGKTRYVLDLPSATGQS